MFTKENASAYGKRSSRKGVKNKANFEIKEAFKDLLTNNLEKLQQDIDNMESVQRVNALLQVAKYLIPTLKAVEVDIEQTNEDDTLKKLMSFSESDFDKLN